MSYSVVVIGAGQIACGYDTPTSSEILTHVHAINLEPRLACAGIFDIDPDRARAQGLRWGVPALTSLEEAFARPVDVAVIATPDSAHASLLEQLLACKVRLVLCEKPLAQSAATARRLVEAYACADRSLAVNYQRRYERCVLELKARLEAGALGRPLAGAVWYSKGVLHNGSHAVDLLRFLFGEVERAMPRRRVFDYTEADPTVSGTLGFAALEVELIAGDERQFSLFEIDLLFERGRYRFTQSGMRLERLEPKPDPIFPGYREIASVWQGDTQLSRAMLAVWRTVADHLECGSPMATTATGVLGTQIACEALQTRALDIWFTPERE